MRDDSVNGEPEQPIEPPVQGEPEYGIDRLKQRLGGSFGGRPLMVYLVLFAGAATLLLLLVIVWYSATGGGKDESPLCTAISADEASQLILAGQVGRVDVLVDRDQPLQSLTLIVLRLNDGTCRQTAQGADVRNDLYRILGVIEIYNNFGEERVRVHYQRQDVQTELLLTSTSTPTFTPIPTGTPTLAPTLAPTEPPTASVPPPTETPAVSAPSGSPQPAATVKSPVPSSTVPGI